MDDELEDKILYQTYISYMKLLSKFAVGFQFNPTYIWRPLRLYLLRPELVIIAVLLFVTYLYIQTFNVWNRGLFSRFLDRPKSINFLGAGEKLSWELSEKCVAAFAIQGRRVHMEDRFVINEDIDKSGISVYAVFDGHGGEFAANFARDNLMKSINERLIEVKKYQKENKDSECPYLQIKKEDEPATVNSGSPKLTKSNEKDKRSSFRKTASATDEFASTGTKQVTDPHLLNLLNALPRPITRQVQSGGGTVKIQKAPITSYLDSSQFSGINYGKIITDEVLASDKLLVEAAKKTMDVAGTTALIALIEGDHLVVANVGDSRGVMCDSKGNAIPLSFDHKPQQIKERKRIRDAGGFISYNGVWRVAGILATSRALGDYPLKDKKLVIPDPDILTFNLTDHKPSFMLLASDGLWDTFSNEEAVSFIKERLDEVHFGAKSLALQSYYRGSLDNITVMVINFKNMHWSSYSKKSN